MPPPCSSGLRGVSEEIGRRPRRSQSRHFACGRRPRESRHCGSLVLLPRPARGQEPSRRFSAHGPAMRADPFAKFHGDVTPAAANVEARQPDADPEAFEQRSRAQLHRTGEDSQAFTALNTTSNRRTNHRPVDRACPSPRRIGHRHPVFIFSTYCWVNDDQHLIRHERGEPLEMTSRIISSFCKWRAARAVSDRKPYACWRGAGAGVAPEP